MSSKDLGHIVHQACRLVVPANKSLVLKVAQGAIAPQHTAQCRPFHSTPDSCLLQPQSPAFLMALPLSLGQSCLGTPVFTGRRCTAVAWANSGVRLP